MEWGMYCKGGKKIRMTKQRQTTSYFSSESYLSVLFFDLLVSSQWLKQTDSRVQQLPTCALPLCRSVSACIHQVAFMQRD